MLLIQVFSHIEDTGIPGLVDYVHSITRIRRRCGIEKIITNLGHFIAGVAGYLIDLGSQVRQTFIVSDRRCQNSYSFF